MIFIIIFIIVLFSIYYIYSIESFRSGIPSGYGRVYSPYPTCDSNNNCHKGYYFRSQSYNNYPQFTALGSMNIMNIMTKFKKPLNCLPKRFINYFI